MTEFHGVLDLQVESLIDTLGARQKARCGEIERDAERRAKHLLDENRRKLRKRPRPGRGHCATQAARSWPSELQQSRAWRPSTTPAAPR